MRRIRSRGTPAHRVRARARTPRRSRGTSQPGCGHVGADMDWSHPRGGWSAASRRQSPASGTQRLLPMPSAGMDSDVRVLVMEPGLGLTHDLTLACRHTGVGVFGPVRDVAEARAAIGEVAVDVIALELAKPSSDAIRRVVDG